MVNRLGVLALGVLTCVAFVMMFIGVEQNAQDKVGSRADDPPTEIQDGVMTPKQRKHSKLYRQPEQARSLIGKVNRNVTAIIGEPIANDAPENGFLPSRYEYFGKVVCGADVILAGRVKEKTSQLSEVVNQSLLTTS